MTPLVIDFESFYSNEYQLRKLSTEEYIRDPRFQTIGVGVRTFDNRFRHWFEHAHFKAWATQLDWSQYAVLAHHCVKGDVEVLTPRGWVRLDRYDGIASVMQWDPTTGELSFTPAQRLVSTFVGDLVSWGTNFHSCSYTPNHRMFYSTPDVAQWRVKTAAEVSRMGKNNVYVPVSGVLNPRLPVRLSPDEARLLEAIRADGSWSNIHGVNPSARFKFRKPRKIARLRGLLETLAVSFKQNTKGEDTVVSVSPHPTLRKIYDLLGDGKCLDSWVTMLTQEAREAIIEETKYWDGSIRPNSLTGWTFSTADESTAEWLQVMCHVSGYLCNGSWVSNSRGMSAHLPNARLYRAGIHKKTRVKLIEHSTSAPYSGDVYCLTVPTGAFMVRSNGKVGITGNSHFDGLILSHHYGVSPGYWFDTLSMANAIHGPTVAKSLDKLAERYGIGRKGREVHDFKGLRREDFTPEQWASYGHYCMNDCDLEYELFLRLLPALPQREEHDLIDMTIRMFTEPELELDQPKMEDYLAYERERKRLLLERTGHDKSVFMSNDKFAALLVDLGVEPGLKLSPAALKRGETEYVYAFAKSDEFMKGLLEHDDPDVRAAAECRIGAKSTINETRTERYLSTWSRGALPVYLKYAVAGTFRFGGGDKSNWQNMERTNKKNPRKGTLRKSVKAPPGKALVVVDSSQIEARLNAALNGETWLIEAFANRRDVYSEFASVIYSRTIDRKKNPGDELAGFVAKVCVLALGFGMWWPKLAVTLLTGALGGDPMHFGKDDMDRMGIDPGRFLNNPKQVERAREIPTRLSTNEILIHAICSDEVVKRYRQKNNRIVGGSDRNPTNSGWRYAQDVVLPLMEALSEGQYVRLDGFSIELHATRHGIRLPNGMTMDYPGLERRGDQWSFMGGKSGKEREYTYGGKIIENIVQALARIVVAYQLLAMRKKYDARIKMTTHDEGVILVDEARAPEMYQLALNEFRTPPEWCPWLPLDAEGGFGKVYGDIK